MGVLVVIEFVPGFAIMLLGLIFIALGVLDKKSKILKNIIYIYLKIVFYVKIKTLYLQAPGFSY